MGAAQGDGECISTVLNLFSKPPVPTDLKNENLLFLATALTAPRVLLHFYWESYGLHTVRMASAVGINS